MLYYCNNVILLVECLRGPERLRGRVEVPGGTNSLADMFCRNLSASGYVPPGTSARRNKSAMTPAIALARLYRDAGSLMAILLLRL